MCVRVIFYSNYYIIILNTYLYITYLSWQKKKTDSHFQLKSYQTIQGLLRSWKQDKRKKPLKKRSLISCKRWKTLMTKRRGKRSWKRDRRNLHRRTKLSQMLKGSSRRKNRWTSSKDVCKTCSMHFKSRRHRWSTLFLEWIWALLETECLLRISLTIKRWCRYMLQERVS